MQLYTECHNSRQGRSLVTDDSGALCSRQSLLPNGCCRSDKMQGGKRGNCGLCRVDVQCCRSYEYCVSCCLSQLDSSDRDDESLPNAVATLGGASPRYSFHSFDRCLHLCRTSSRSIRHGNQYKTGILKHCYTEGEHSIPLDMGSARIVVGEQGVSCSRACNAYRGENVPSAPTTSDNPSPSPNGAEEDAENPETPSPFLPPATENLFICHESFLPLLNNCDTMKKYFGCKADECENSSGGDQPALLPPKGSSAAALGDRFDASGRPRGTCLINSDPKLFDCEGHHADTRRLCACV
jgi:hypothetical protein